MSGAGAGIGSIRTACILRMRVCVRVCIWCTFFYFPKDILHGSVKKANAHTHTWWGMCKCTYKRAR